MTKQVPKPQKNAFLLKISPLLLGALTSGLFPCQAHALKKYVQVTPDSITVAAQDSISRSRFGNYQVPNATEAFPILYGVQPKDNLVQSVSYLNGRQLEKVPTALIRNAWAGQLAGLSAIQSSGEPRYDGATLNVRGGSPLILIDGIPRTFSSINPEQIESVTVLKDALSTAMLGMRGMNGAILITTRHKAEKPGIGVTFTAQSGVQTPIKLRKVLGAYEYARLYNEALANDGKAPAYSPADLEAYQHGSDPYGHPDVDWYKTLLKDKSGFNRYTLSTSGNYNNVNFFVSLDYLNQQGLLKEDAANSYSTNTAYQRYLVRSNLDIKLNNRLSAYLNILGNIQDSNEPGYTTNSIFNSILNTPNNSHPVYNPNGSYAGNQNFQYNPYGLSVGTGYLKNNQRDSFVDLGLKRNLDDLVPGLWTKVSISYNTMLEQIIDRSKLFEVFQFSQDPISGDTTYNRIRERTDQVNLSNVNSRQQQTYAEVALGYDRSWGKHGLNGLILGNRDNYQYGANLNEIYQNLSSRFSYSFDNRYLLEFAGAYSGNNRYTPGNQFGFFPSAGVGWNVHKESFLKDKSNFISQLKIRASYGKVGNANPGYYLYQRNYVSATGYMFGTTMAANSGRAEGPLPNIDRTWEKSNKFNAGFDLGFARQRGWLFFDYYNNQNYDLLQVRGSNTEILGTDFPEENIGENKYSGVEVNAGWANKIGLVDYYVSGNFATRDSRVLFMDEVNYPYAWMQRTGGRVGQARGYVADGFFNASNLNAPTIEGYQPVPGDIRYQDLNNDGLINQFDQTAIGNQKPFLIYGTTLGLRVKGFDLSLLVQGMANRNIFLTGSDEWEFQNNGRGQAYAHHLNRWTPETASTATYPRLSVGTNDNNHIGSSFWIQSGDFLRLKNAELGYNFSPGLLSRAKVQSVRLFLNGLNLYTISEFKKGDPETYQGVYPLQRVFNGGITVNF
jgi:TonB-linked SusC/RagA family outer membrane protein